MLARLSGVFKKGGSLPSSPAPAAAATPKAPGTSGGKRAAASTDEGEVEAILAACAVADSTGDWTSLRFLITWRGCSADDVWDVPLSAFGSSPAACLAAADAALADSYEHFSYLGVPRAAFRCETLLKTVYVNWRHFNGAWLGAPAAVALAAERRQRLSRVADSFPVAVPAMSDAAFTSAVGRGPELPADWVNPNAAAKAKKAPSEAKAKGSAKKEAKGAPKPKLAKVQKPAKGAPKAKMAAAKLAPKPAAERKKPGPKPKAKAAKAVEPESEPEASDEDKEEEEEDEEFAAPPRKKAATTPKSAAAKAGGAEAGATPKRKPGRPPKVLPFAASPTEAAQFAAAAVAKASTPAKRAEGASPSGKKRGRPSNADRAAAAAAAAAARS